MSSDAGSLLPRELDERLGLSALIEQHLTDPRTGHDRHFQLPDLFRQFMYSHLAGYGPKAESLGGKFVCWKPFC